MCKRDRFDNQERNLTVKPVSKRSLSYQLNIESPFPLSRKRYSSKLFSDWAILSLPASDTSKKLYRIRFLLNRLSRTSQSWREDPTSFSLFSSIFIPCIVLSKNIFVIWTTFVTQAGILSYFFGQNLSASLQHWFVFPMFSFVSQYISVNQRAFCKC